MTTTPKDTEVTTDSPQIGRDYKRVLIRCLSGSDSVGDSNIETREKKVIIHGKGIDRISIPYDVRRESQRKRNIMANRGTERINSSSSED